MTGTTPYVISTTSLTKRFGRQTAVDGIDLQVQEGDRYGFLGPNGSGKTTTVRMLLGLVFATSGQIEVLGHAVPRRSRRALPEIGALVEGPAFWDHLSARKNLSLLDAAGPRGPSRTRRDRCNEALERVGLGGVGRKPVGAYSLGMRQRLGLAAALLRRPRLLILDEPTNGLDPQGIAEIRELLLALNREGTTVFLSSHLLSEVEQLCTRVGVLDRGRLVLQEDLAAVAGPTGRLELRTPDVDRLPGLLGDALVERGEGNAVVRGIPAPELARRLVAGEIRIEALTEQRRTLESTVLERTGAGSDRVDRTPPADGKPDPKPEPKADATTDAEAEAETDPGQAA